MTRVSSRVRAGRAARRTLALGSGAALLAGCQFGGLNSVNMPGTAGHGKGAVDDVTVGSVSGIEAVQKPDGTFYAAVELSLDSNVKLPANATVKVAQTSLLGSQHIELAPPAGRTACWRAAGWSPDSAEPRQPLSHDRGSAVRSWGGRQQGQSRCAAGHHAGALHCGGRS